jgi:hypothetical protein
MPVFNGTIRLEEGDGLDTTMIVDSGRLVVTAGEHEIGNWAVDELSVRRQNDEFRVQVEGEEIAVAVTDPAGFSEVLGIQDRTPKRRRAKKPSTDKGFKRKEHSQAEEGPAAPTPVVVARAGTAEPSPAVSAPRSEPSPPVPPLPAAATTETRAPGEEPSMWSRLPMRFRLAGIGLVGLVILGLIAPSLLALLLMLVGMVTLFLGIAARSDSGTSFLPPPLFATTAAAVGGIGMVLLAVVIIAIT